MISRTQKYPKLISLLFCFIMILQLINLSVYADFAIETQPFEVGISGINVSKLDSNGISGSVTLSNNTNTVLENLDCSFNLNFETSDNSYSVLTFSKKVSLTKYQTNVLKFDCSQKFAFPAGDYNLTVKVVSSSGKTIGICAERYENKGSGKKIVLYDVEKSKFNDVEIFPEALAGPSFDAGVSPVLSVALKNLSAQSLNTTARIKIYNRSMELNPNPIVEKYLPENVLLAIGEEKAFNLSLPAMNEPGSYYANILLYDNSENVVSSIIEARYVVRGVAGKIADSKVIVENGRLNLNEFLIGPADGKYVNVVKFTIAIKDENGTIIYTNTSYRDLGPFASEVNFSIPFTKKAGFVDVVSKIEYADKILDVSTIRYSVAELIDDVGNPRQSPTISGQPTPISNPVPNPTSVANPTTVPNPTSVLNPNRAFDFGDSIVTLFDGILTLSQNIVGPDVPSLISGISANLVISDENGNVLFNKTSVGSLSEGNLNMNFATPLNIKTGKIYISVILYDNDAEKKKLITNYQLEKFLIGPAVKLLGSDTVIYCKQDNSDAGIVSPDVTFGKNQMIKLRETLASIKNNTLLIDNTIASSVTNTVSDTANLEIQVLDSKGETVFEGKKSVKITNTNPTIRFEIPLSKIVGNYTVNTSIGYYGSKNDSASTVYDSVRLIDSCAVSLGDSKTLYFGNSTEKIQNETAINASINEISAEVKGGNVYIFEKLNSSPVADKADVKVGIEVIDESGKVVFTNSKIGDISSGTLLLNFVGAFTQKTGKFTVRSTAEYAGNVVDKASVDVYLDRLNGGKAFYENGMDTVVYENETPINNITPIIDSTVAKVVAGNFILTENIKSADRKKVFYDVGLRVEVYDLKNKLIYQQTKTGNVQNGILSLEFMTLLNTNSDIIVASYLEYQGEIIDAMSAKYSVEKLLFVNGKTNEGNSTVKYEEIKLNTIKISDVTGTPFEESVQTLVDNGIIKGYPDGTFKPYGKITRAEFMALAYSLIKKIKTVEATTVENSFQDLLKSHWAYNLILEGTSLGLLKGYPDKTFRPNANINYEEAITVCVKLLSSEAENNLLKVWPDDYLKAGKDKNLYPDITFGSRVPATRGDVAKIIYNVFRKYKD